MSTTYVVFYVIKFTDQKSVATQTPTPIQSMNTTHIKNLKNPMMLSRSTMAKPMEDTVNINSKPYCVYSTYSPT